MLIGPELPVKKIAGIVAVKVDYYYANVATPRGITYHAWFIHPMSSAKGYQTACCVRKCSLFGAGMSVIPIIITHICLTPQLTG